VLTQGNIAVRQRNLLLLVAAAAGVSGLVQTAEAAAAPADSGAHRAASIPDFSGIWSHPSIPGFEPLASGPTSVTNLARREGGVSDNRKLVGDYRNPILKPAAADIVKRHGEISIAGIGYPTPRNQCWPGGVPFEFYNIGMQMLQHEDEIIILYSNDREVRRVRMNAPHGAAVTPSWYGDSVGHYEGYTLVIDTIGIKIGPYAMVDWYGTPRSEALRVVERYRLLDYEEAKDGLERDAKENFQVQPGPPARDDGGKYLQLLFTVEDEGAFTTPWSATITYRLSQGEWLEAVCAENPYKYGTEPDAAIPTAEKPDF
jgi:hypothetical protein